MNITANMVETHVFRINNGNMEFLLLKRGEGDIYPKMWQMVTGRIEENEKAYKTALREVFEESSLKVLELWTLPNINSFYSAANDSLNFIIVFAALVDSNAEVLLSEEHTEFKWVGYEAYFNTLVWEGQRKSAAILYDYYNNRKSDLDLVRIKNE